MKLINLIVRIGVFALAGGLLGCAMGPDYSRPEIQLGTAFLTPASAGDSFADLEWWQIFKDPNLQTLIKQALEENRDLQAATARVEAAAAMLGMARADLFPTVSIGGTASRLDLSNKILQFNPRPRNVFGVFGELSYELDIWGRVRRMNEAEKANLLGTEYARNALTISLISSVARTYLTILSLDNQIAIAEGTTKNRRGYTSLIDARFQKGVVPELDLNQAQYEQEIAVISATQLRRARAQSMNALSVLLGRTPFQIPVTGAMDAQIAITDLPSGVPASLLERRPDVRAAEEALHAATAMIGVAKAERLPTLDLGGMIAFQGRHLNQVFNQDSFAWRYGVDLAGPLLDFGRSLSRVEAAEASALEALKNYESTILGAVREVEDASVAVSTFYDEYQSTLRQVKAAKNATKLSHARYDEGMTAYLEVLDVDRSLFDAELSSVAARENYLNSIIKLYGALGGGWKQDKEEKVLQP